MVSERAAYKIVYSLQAILAKCDEKLTVNLANAVSTNIIYYLLRGKISGMGDFDKMADKLQESLSTQLALAAYNTSYKLDEFIHDMNEKLSSFYQFMNKRTNPFLHKSKELESEQAGIEAIFKTTYRKLSLSPVMICNQAGVCQRVFKRDKSESEENCRYILEADRAAFFKFYEQDRKTIINQFTLQEVEDANYNAPEFNLPTEMSSVF